MKSVYRSLLVLFLLAGIGNSLVAQAMPRGLRAARCDEAPRLDGRLDEPCWQQAEAAADFITTSPVPGAPLPQSTEVRILYTDESLYVGFMNYDTRPDSILQQLSGRDHTGNSDYCGITFNCYRDGINGFTFMVSPRGEQWDARITAGSAEDVSWNAVWDCHTRITHEGWVAEFQIPYAALRFPEAEEQDWDINFFRDIRRIRFKGYWNEVVPNGPPYLTQMGRLSGIRGIVPPKRIFFYPYLSYYTDWAEQDGSGPQLTTRYNGGMDMKLGLSDAFTLDATLIPDFGQTISDALILNLTPFEIQFQDNRQFFIEGTELFNKIGVFYSRRVGGQPIGYQAASRQLRPGERLVENPVESQLLNAVKVSGRTPRGLGIGVFNALTGITQATAEDEEGNQRRITTSPLTNYNVLVFDQNLPHNSYFTLLNTNTLRNGDFYDANLTAYQFDLRNRKNSYSLSSNGAFVQKQGPGELTDPQGFSHSLTLGKISGNWNWKLSQYMLSDTYDPNDLGFLTANNQRGYSLWNAYNIYKPFGRFNNLWSNVTLDYRKLFRPDVFTSFRLTGNVGLTTRKFLSYSLTFESQPARGYDYFEPRVDGRYFRTFSYLMTGGWISSDYRKRLAIDYGNWYTRYENDGRFVLNWRLSPRFRVNDRLMIVYVYSHQNHFGDLGFATFDSSGEPVFGKRDVISHTNVLTFTYSFTPFMNLNCRVRHYWGYSRYAEFFDLRNDGSLGNTDFIGFGPSVQEQPSVSAADRNFNSFTIDLFFRWNFRPGSEMVFAWKNAIIEQTVGQPIPSDLIRDLDYVFGLPQVNSLSLRVIYFLDYRVLTGRKGEAITRNSLH